MSDIQDSLALYRHQLVGGNDEALKKLINAYGNTWRKLRPQLERITRRIQAALENGEQFSPSRFDKDPARIDKLQEELDMAIGLQAELRAAAPQARIIYKPGNHEDRLRKWLWKHPEIASLQSLKLDNLLKLDHLGIQMVQGELIHQGLLIEHGEYVRKKAGGSADAQLLARGKSGISGHTHRLIHYPLADATGTKTWTETGCICRLNPDYCNYPNWQQGLVLSYMDNDRLRIVPEYF